MGCCASKSSDDSNGTSFPASSSSHHPKARRRYHNKRYPAQPSSPKPSNKAHHATVSPLTSLDDVERVKEVLTERPASATRPMNRPNSAPRVRNNSANNSIDGPAAAKKKSAAAKNGPPGAAASSFSFDKKDSPAGERNHAIPLASDIWSITGAAPMAPPKRGNHGAAIQLNSEIWSIADGPPRMAPPSMMMLNSAAAARRPGPVPFIPRKYSSPGKRDSAAELNRYSAERERGSTMSPIKRDGRKQSSYGSPGSTRRGERQGPYLAGRERQSPLSRESERERRPVAVSPQKRERERERDRDRERNSSSSVRKESGSLRNGGGSSEMRRWADMEGDGYGRRSAGSPAVRGYDGMGKKNVRSSWGVPASPERENERRTNKGRNATVSPSGPGNESSDSSLSIEGFVFL